MIDFLVNDKQKETLKSLHFWRKNQLAAKRDNDFLEVEKSDKAIRDLFNRADEQKIPFKYQNSVMDHAEHKREESFSDMSFENTMSIKDSHSLKVVSKEETSDIEEVAKIIIKNCATGKEHTFSVWTGDIEKNELEPYYVYLNNPQEVDSKNTLDDALYDSTLFEVIKYDEQIEKSIEAFNKDSNQTFSYEIPKEMQGLDLHYMIIDEEVADLLIKSEKGLLEKKDITDFGKLVENDSPLEGFNPDNLKDPFLKVLKENDVSNETEGFILPNDNYPATTITPAPEWDEE